MNAIEWYAIVFSFIFILLATGLITLLFSRSTYAKIRAIPYALVYGMGIVAWLASLIYVQFVANTLLAHRFSFSAGYVVTLGMLGLALTFPNSPQSKKTKHLLAFDMCAGLIFAGLIFFTDYVLAAANFSGAKTASFSVLGKIYLLILAVHLLCAVTIFVRRYLTEVRNRLYFNYIVLAFILSFLISTITNLILPLLGVVALALVGPLSALLPFIAVVYALGITDIDDVSYIAAQLLRVGARLVATIALFVVGLLFHRIFGLAYYTSTWVIAMSVVVGVGIVLFYLFGSRFDRSVENKIAYSRLSPDEARSKLIMSLSGAIELERNVSAVLKLIKQAIGIRAAGIALVAKDGAFWTSGDLALLQTDVRTVLQAIAALPARRANHQSLLNVTVLPAALKQMLEEQGIYAVKPLRTESGIEGLYLLGEKFSQEIFTRQDAVLMHAMTEISDLSIERALFYTEIQSFNATLQQRVDDATLRLRTANKRLKTLDALKDDFISMASHQLRSPATSVRDAIKMLEQLDLSPTERQQILQLAGSSSERLVSVVTDMLSVARIQAGHFTLEKTTVDMAELVDRALLQASALLKEKAIAVAFERPVSPISLRADRAKLNEVISNYIENAIKYSDEHTTITINLKRAAERVAFTVDDQGIGVPEAERKELFTKFYRATNARHEQPNGNGIGLFVVKTVAEAHGGGTLYEPLEHGSRFGFWLPA